MVKREIYPDGEPCWADAMVRDTERSRQFYAAVFGWTYEVSGPEYGGYIMCLAEGRPAAGLMPWTADMGDVPSMWSLYLSASNTDAAAEKIASTGGRLLMDPVDIPDNGRMAFGFDPAGAAFGVWQAAGHLGFGATNEHGTFSWGELVTPDTQVDQFYQGLFGYEQRQTGDRGVDYTTWSLGGAPICGRMLMPAELAARNVPAHWAVYFAVDDADVALAKITAAGGSVIRTAHDSPYGRLAAVADPEGAPFHIIDLSRVSAAS